MPAPRLFIDHRLGRLLRAVAGSVCSHQRQYITVQPIDTTASAGGVVHDPAVQAVTVDSAEAFAPLARHLPPSFRDSADELAKRLAGGCVLTIALRRGETGSPEILGYELAERGVFSALGRRHAAPLEVIFSHWAEVVPAYRGRRIHALLFATRDAYFGRRGGGFVCGVVATRNRASLQALARARSIVVGTVIRVSIFRELLVWKTSRKQIDDMLQQLGSASDNRDAAAPAGPLGWARATSFEK